MIRNKSIRFAAPIALALSISMLGIQPVHADLPYAAGSSPALTFTGSPQAIPATWPQQTIGGQFVVGFVKKVDPADTRTWLFAATPNKCATPWNPIYANFGYSGPCPTMKLTLKKGNVTTELSIKEYEQFSGGYVIKSTRYADPTFQGAVLGDEIKFEFAAGAFTIPADSSGYEPFIRWDFVQVVAAGGRGVGSNGVLGYYSAQAVDPSAPVAPSKPAAPTAVASKAKATVTIVPNTSGVAATSYRVTAAPGGAFCDVNPPAVQCDVTGLANGTAYKFSVVAKTSTLSSIPSDESSPVTPVDPNADVAPVEGDGDLAPKAVPSEGTKKFVATNDSSFQVAWDKKNGKLISRATGIYTGYIQAVATFTVAGKTHTCSAVFGTLKAMPMKTAAQKTASMRSKTFTGKQFCVDKIKMDARTLAPKGGMTAANFKKIKSMNKTSAELAKEKLALAALKNFTGEVQVQVTRYRAWPTTMVNIGDHNSKGGKIPFLVRNTKVNLG